MRVEKRVNKRVQWADIAKGISIIAVIASHTPLEYTWWGTFINSFRMPLFLFVAGFFFSSDKYGDARGFVRRKARTLLLPYAVFAGGSFLYFLARYTFGDSSYYEDLNIYQVFFGIFYSAGTREWMDFNLPLWFLTFLFVVEVLFYGMKRQFRRKTSLIAVLILCSVIGYIDGLWNPYKLPWGVDVAMTGVVFYGAGHLLKDMCKQWLGKPISFKLFFFVLLLGLNIATLTVPMNLNMKVHGQYYDFYFAAFCGISWCLLLSSMIRSKILTYIGRNSLILMAVHSPLLRVSTRLADYFQIPSDPYVLDVLRVVVTILFATPIIYIINNFCPWMLGRETNFSWKAVSPAKGS